jgi:hypothetical protein
LAAAQSVTRQTPDGNLAALLRTGADFTLV